jgi:hypothetical protein
MNIIEFCQYIFIFFELIANLHLPFVMRSVGVYHYILFNTLF